MPQDAFTIKYVAEELAERLAGGKISKIIQFDRDNLSFIVYTKNGTVKLHACLSAKNCRLSLTALDRPTPQVAPGFCMLLRKHLSNAEITRIRQIPHERIVYFDLDCVSEFEHAAMRLYFELMGKYSNAVLTKDGIILGALKSTAIGENTRRALFTGARYVLPEPQDKICADDIPALKKLLESGDCDPVKLIAEHVKGVAYSTAADIVESCKNNLTAEAVNAYICGGERSPCVVFSNGEPTDFKARFSGEGKPYPTVLDAQMAYYDRIIASQSLNDERKSLETAVAAAKKKLEKRLQVIEEKLLECRGADDVKLKGELITANIYAVERGMSSFTAVNYYDENGGKITIALDKSLTPSQNAQRYYKKYAKLKRTERTVSEQKLVAGREAEYLKSVEAHIRSAETAADLAEVREEMSAAGLIKRIDTGRKKPKAPSPFRSYLIGGFRVLAGRSNLQNDRLLKSAAGGDIWLHTHGYHSSHVVIICNGGEVPDETIKAAAEICAYYSDGREGTKVPVDYTRRKFVKKPPASAAGFVIYTDYKTALAEPKNHPEFMDNI